MEIYKRELIERIKSLDLSCVERGEAAVVLTDSGMEAVRVAAQTGLSEALISNLRACHDKLLGKARQSAIDKTMEATAAYLLAKTGLSGEQQNIVLGMAQQRAKTRQTSETGKPGRKNPLGNVTRNDMRDALRAYKLDQFDR